MSDYADYKTMYYTMMQASEKAIRILIEAQRQCEEIYLNQREPSLTLLPIKDTGPEKNRKNNRGTGKCPVPLAFMGKVCYPLVSIN